MQPSARCLSKPQSGALQCDADDKLAIVAIGRNEGARLVAALQSALASSSRVFYVDSGSTDGSVEACRKAGGIPIELDMSRAFTAARARNTGWRQVLAKHPGTHYVQFIDGDCALDPDWLATAVAYLESHNDVAVVFGRRKERFADATIYNKLCDMSWASPPGEVKYFGGDALVRVEALRRVEGYRDDLIAGEEPELAVRLRGAGWKIVCLDAPMTLHDADMHRFGQWWRRTVRTGYAYAQGAWIHGQGPSRHWVRETLRALLWGAALPMLMMLLTLLFGPIGLAPGLIYAMQGVRIWMHERKRLSSAGLYAVFTVLGKVPEAIGVLSFALDTVTSNKRALIEYK